MRLTYLLTLVTKGKTYTITAQEPSIHTSPFQFSKLVGVNFQIKNETFFIDTRFNKDTNKWSAKKFRVFVVTWTQNH